MALTLDVGNLLISGITLSSNLNKEEELEDLRQKGLLYLWSELCKLPYDSNNGTVELPEPTTLLPREKPLPPPKRETKWEKFAKLKGISKKKKSRMVFDIEKKKYLPRFGYQRANDPSQDWMLEVPNNADPYEDQFEKIKKTRQENVSKNELQRLRNLKQGLKVPSAQATKKELNQLIDVARKSDASLGQFSKVLKQEKKRKSGNRQKFASNFSFCSKDETARSLQILKEIKQSTASKQYSQQAEENNVHTKKKQKHKQKRLSGPKKMKQKVDRTGKKRKHNK